MQEDLCLKESCIFRMKRVFNYLLSIACSRVFLSQDWLPTVQLVLQAD